MYHVISFIIGIIIGFAAGHLSTFNSKRQINIMSFVLPIAGFIIAVLYSYIGDMQQMTLLHGGEYFSSTQVLIECQQTILSRYIIGFIMFGLVFNLIQKAKFEKSQSDFNEKEPLAEKNLIQVFTGSLVDANNKKILLQDSGIETFEANEAKGWQLMGGHNIMKIFVDKDDAAKAKNILRNNLEKIN